MALAAILPACAHGGSLGPPAAPGGGEVAGRLVSQTSDGSNQTVEAGQRIGVYTEAFSGGPVLQNPPRPIATAVTSSEGLFVFRGLEPGRYFISATGQGTGVGGRWVTVTGDRGASVVLVRCTDCPVPL
jgi:hypothetical protein